jgi:hypothetical protein
VHNASTLALAALAAALVACGMPTAPQPDAVTLLAQAAGFADPRAMSAGNDAARMFRAPRGRAPLLLSPFGEMPPPAPEAAPRDPTVRTRSGLYATTAQAEALDGLHGGDAAWVEVGCCSLKDVEVALGVAAGQAAAKDLPADAPFFVSGASPHLAALAVDRLNDQGYTRVFLVTR